ncbi:hypothetical protein Harman_03230 [Haloarcula mannanilytica]|uniref:DUF211 domain-containing protein n=1 Tax=Haloarcula mannanilytica TaxID=2509225 RepID=A0A4C2ECY9_9EURY|nr:DUF211 domain-containing protein [Haloarcula mannanilytica]GCF12388.1 hypothetical protein Harman_03230 [Haloarcula mannanilytica]
MSTVRRIVIDVLKPHDPPLVDFTERLTTEHTVVGVTASLVERDKEVQNVKLTIEGDGVDYASIQDAVEELGASVHSIDEVSCGERVIEERATFQDR